MVWDMESKKLKALVNDDADYDAAIKDLRETQVLYIDDFLKTKKGASPTDADIKLAFEIINFRYNNSKLTTLISSEFTINEVINFDEATGSRILERSGKYALAIGKDRTKNWRINSVIEQNL